MSGLVFYLPLVLGLAFVVGSAWAIHHHDDGGLFGTSTTILLMIALFSFGGAGVVAGILGVPWPLSLGVAMVATLPLTAVTARLVARLLPSSESYLVSRRELAGCSGTLLLHADGESGWAQVRDREGNVYNLRCRAVDGALEKGASILVVAYDETTGLYLVDAN
jgi:membrane protein implicated in regulation of membrane protease activity